MRHHESNHPICLTAKVEKCCKFRWIALLHRSLQNFGCQVPWFAPVSEKVIHGGPCNQEDEKNLQMAFAKALGAFAFCDLPEKGWWWENLGRNQNNVGLWYHYHYHLTYLWGYSCRKWMKSDVQLCNLDCIRIAPRRCVRGGQMGRGTCSTPLQGPSDQP